MGRAPSCPALCLVAALGGCYTSSESPPEYRPEECDTRVSAPTPLETMAILAGDSWILYADLAVDPDPRTYLMLLSVGGTGGPMSTGVTRLNEWEPLDGCELCMVLYQDCGPTGACEHAYMPKQARLEIHEIDLTPGGRLRATLSELHMLEWDQYTDTLVPDGLSYCVDAWTIDEVFVVE